MTDGRVWDGHHLALLRLAARMTGVATWALLAHGITWADVDVLADYNARPPKWKEARPHLANQMGRVQVAFEMATRATMLDADAIPIPRHMGGGWLFIGDPPAGFP